MNFVILYLFNTRHYYHLSLALTLRHSPWWSYFRNFYNIDNKVWCKCLYIILRSYTNIYYTQNCVKIIYTVCQKLNTHTFLFYFLTIYFILCKIVLNISVFANQYISVTNSASATTLLLLKYLQKMVDCLRYRFSENH